MKHKMYVIYDSKAKAYMQPWFLTTTPMAQRLFTDCVNDKDHNFGRHPEDYTLFTIGNFDDNNAKIEWKSPEALGNGVQYIVTEKTGDQIDFLQKEIEDGKAFPLTTAPHGAN